MKLILPLELAFYLQKRLYMNTSLFHRGSIHYFFWKSCCLILISNNTNWVIHVQASWKYKTESLTLVQFVSSFLRNNNRLRHRARNKAPKRKMKWYFRLTKRSSVNYEKQQTHGPYRLRKEQFQSKLWLYKNGDKEKKEQLSFLILQ